MIKIKLFQDDIGTSKLAGYTFSKTVKCFTSKVNEFLEKPSVEYVDFKIIDTKTGILIYKQI